MLKGKNALITGASRGIGKRIAIKFAENGAFVGINYLSNEKEAEDTLRQVIKTGGKGILIQGDISSRKEVNNIVDNFLNKKASIDILVNNAGIYPRNKFDKLSLETWKKTISTNLTSSYYLCKKILPNMKENSKIIFISSQIAFKGSSHGADYASSKAGMLGLMRSLALELGKRKICVNAVAPGVIDTDILSSYSLEMKKERIKQIPLSRLGKPDDIANTCLFLASDLSNYITGETINVNGGIYIH